MFYFLCYRSIAIMPAHYLRLRGKQHQSFQGAEKESGVSTVKVCSADGTPEKGVSGEQQTFPVEAYAARRMAGGVQDPEGELSERNGVPVFQRPVRFRKILGRKTSVTSRMFSTFGWDVSTRSENTQSP